MKIVLIGFACCYKSSAGKLLAQKLNCTHIDVDKVVEDIAGKSVSDIFAQDGEYSFREKENGALKKIAANINDMVVSCGGGSVLSACFAELAANSTVVWLTACSDTVSSRLGREQRPLFDNLGIDELSAAIASRTPFYNQYADYSVSTDNKTSVEVANEILALLINDGLICDYKTE